ncbi:molybdenum cofactor biosynthesis enzyme MoaA [Rhizobium sp. 1399]|nr:molybdenum cofactor biosynthesis enzyme MoaA [Rhizobium sp. 1399]
MTHNFCENCNRVRVTAAGVLHTCLGQNDAADPKEAIRAPQKTTICCWRRSPMPSSISPRATTSSWIAHRFRRSPGSVLPTGLPARPFRSARPAAVCRGQQQYQTARRQ